MRVLKAYLKLFFNESVAGEAGAGKDVLQGNPLRMPTKVDMASFKRSVQALPDADAPIVFCLPDNIERSLQRNNSSAAIKQLRALSAVGVEVNKFDREKWRVQLGPILELWQQMVSSSPGVLAKRDREGVIVKQGGGQGSALDPVDDFVAMESTMSGTLCNLVDGALAALKKVLFGSGLLSHIQSMAIALLNGKVPPEWTKSWGGGPEKPQAWIRELVRKRLALAKWSAASAKGSLENGVVLEDLNPATFVNALRQQTARKLGCAD